MVTILIRRFVGTDKEEAFLTNYRMQKPIENPAFRGETLMRVDDDPALPEPLQGFGRAGCVTYINIAKWDSWQAFAEHFKDAFSKPYNPEFEVAPRERAVIMEVPIPAT
jgi:hypothetical protein